MYTCGLFVRVCCCIDGGNSEAPLLCHASDIKGMNKMVINHLEKLFVTNDAATVIKELEVEHPAARMLVMAMQMMEQEVKFIL